MDIVGTMSNPARPKDSQKLTCSVVEQEPVDVDPIYGAPAEEATEAAGVDSGIASELTASPTMMAPTQAGVILGVESYLNAEEHMRILDAVDESIRGPEEQQERGRPGVVQAAGIAVSLAMRVPAPLKPIADQVIRSASSVPANLNEGHGRKGRDRLHFWRIAYASAKEVDTHLRLLIGAGAVNAQTARKAIQLFDDVRAITWRLLRPKP